MAAQAPGQRRQIHRNLLRILKCGRHVPNFLLRVPVDRRLKEKPVGVEYVGLAAMARANHVKQLALSRHRRIARTFKAQPRAAGFGINAKMHARGFMRKIGGDQILCRGAARAGHRSLRVALVDARMALCALLVAHVTVRVLLRPHWRKRRRRRRFLRLRRRRSRKSQRHDKRENQRPDAKAPKFR